MKKYTLAILCVLFSYCSFAQTPFNSIEYLDINNIKAASALHGDLWWDPSSQTSRCEFPKNSGKHAQFASAIWMSGYSGSQLHVSAERYRDSNDYWPGPLDVSNALSYTTSQNWAKIWKVNASEIALFKQTSNHTIANTPTSILEWPAKGNANAKGANASSLSITTDMAPFVDVNSDGIYDPLAGDYPDIKGDQALWYVFSDNGPTHDETHGQPLQTEIHVMAYAFSRNTLVDNIIFYEYSIINKSPNNYTNFRVALSSDCDLGDYNDDYVGFDSSHRMAILYNGALQDGSGGIGTYGYSAPISGVTLLEMPGDVPNNYLPAGSFIYFNNDYSVIGNPTLDIQYNYYMRASLRDGSHFTNDYTGPGNISKAYGSGPDVNYVYPGDPSATTEWSECNSNNPPGDRRYVLSSADYTFNAGSRLAFSFALVITDTNSNNTCPNASFNAIKQLADTARAWYKTVGIPNVILTKKALKLYPNPAHNELYIDIQKYGNNEDLLQVYDAIGRNITPLYVKSKGKIIVNTSNLPSGLYNVVYRAGDITATNNFIKE